MKLAYSRNTSSPTAVQLQNILDVSNPLQVSRGNPNLKKAYRQIADFTFNGAKPEKNTYYSIRFSLGNNKITTTTRYIACDTLIDNYLIQRGARFRTFENLDGEWNAGMNLTYSFLMNMLKLRVNSTLEYTFNRTPSIYDSRLNYTFSHNGRYNLTLTSVISANIDFNVNSTTSYTWNRRFAYVQSKCKFHFKMGILERIYAKLKLLVFLLFK